MSADGNPPMAASPYAVPMRRSYRICPVCDLPIGESQLCVVLNSGGRLHFDCYVSSAYYAIPALGSSQ